MKARDRYRILLGSLIILGAVSLAVVLSACGSSTPADSGKSAEQVWIEAHPTHAGVLGRCVEHDGEWCDGDPHDLDDMGEVDLHVVPTVRPKVVKSPVVTPKPTGR